MANDKIKEHIDKKIKESKDMDRHLNHGEQSVYNEEVKKVKGLWQ